MQPLYGKQPGTSSSVALPLKAYTRSWLGSSARRRTAWKLSALPAFSGRDALSSAATQDMSMCTHAVR